MEHRDELIGFIHGPFQWSYANASARTGATGFVTADVTARKIAVQTDTNTVWMLTATTPTWVQVGGSAGATTHAIQQPIDGVVYVQDNIVIRRLSYAMTLSKVRLGLSTAPTGTGSTKAKVMYHATDPTAMTTIFSSETNAPAIAAGAYTADSGAPTVTSLAAGGWIGIGFSAICGTTAGTNGIIELLET